MTVLEQLVWIVQTLGPVEQRQVLALAEQLHETQRSPDTSLEHVDLADDASRDAWNERIAARGATMLEQEKLRLRALGLIDDDWNAESDSLPDDMLPSSNTSVET